MVTSIFSSKTFLNFDIYTIFTRYFILTAPQHKINITFYIHWESRKFIRHSLLQYLPYCNALNLNIDET